VSTNNRIVCIVDDEQEITMYFRDALQVINGISISTFTDPILALEHFTINKSAYALVLADLRMSSLNGIDLIKKIKDLNPIVRTILMTGWAIDNNLFIEYAKRKIINAFLQKPIRLNSLREEVNGQLQTYQLQKLFYLLESYKISTISSV
jgi:DNA-binding NtrC family response regulator